MTRRILASYLLPPGLFVTAFAAVAVWHLARKRRVAAAVHLALGALLWALSVPPGADLLTRGLEAPYGALAAPRGDVIVLLGGGVGGGAPDLSGTGAPSAETWVRIGTAVRLQRTLGVPVIVSGGTVFPGKSAEAPVIARILVDLGVPAGQVIPEAGSRDTRENARYTAEIARRAAYRNPVLVTSAYHMRRAVASFRRAGLEVSPCPVGFQTWPGKRYGPEDFLPDGASLRRSSVAAREYAALIAYGDLWR